MRTPVSPAKRPRRCRSRSPANQTYNTQAAATITAVEPNVQATSTTGVWKKRLGSLSTSSQTTGERHSLQLKFQAPQRGEPAVLRLRQIHPHEGWHTMTSFLRAQLIVFSTTICVATGQPSLAQRGSVRVAEPAVAVARPWPSD